MASTQSVQAADVGAHIHPYTNLSLHQQAGPMVITRGEGVYVHDDQGNRYIEALAGLFCASLGFSNERLADAAQRPGILMKSEITKTAKLMKDAGIEPQ